MRGDVKGLAPRLPAAQCAVLSVSFFVSFFFASCSSPPSAQQHVMAVTADRAVSLPGRLGFRGGRVVKRGSSVERKKQQKRKENGISGHISGTQNGDGRAAEEQNPRVIAFFFLCPGGPAQYHAIADMYDCRKSVQPRERAGVWGIPGIRGRRAVYSASVVQTSAAHVKAAFWRPRGNVTHGECTAMYLCSVLGAPVAHYSVRLPVSIAGRRAQRPISP